VQCVELGLPVAVISTYDCPALSSHANIQAGVKSLLFVQCSYINKYNAHFV